MNSLVNQWSDLLQLTHAVRDELWQVVSDSDLKHSLGGKTLTLGGLMKEMGEIEYAYVQSFKTFNMDFTYRNKEAGLDGSVDRLRAWYKQLDDEFNSALNDLSEEDVQNKKIVRPDGDLPAMTNFHFYREGLLMFFGKASLYLKSLRITPPERFNDWAG
jgi:hypothetical protein